MSKLFTPLILIAISILVFIVYVDPTFDRIKRIEADQFEHDTLLNQAKELKKVRDRLLDDFNALDAESKDRLKKMVPDNVDNIRLLIEIDALAAKYGMIVRNVSLPGSGEGEAEALPQTVAEQTNDMGTLVLQFSVASSYDNFISFLGELERSLRLVDVDHVSFKSEGVDFNEYTVMLRTYWLKSNIN